MKQFRIISILPSSSEIVYALGLGNCLVGRSHECDFPPGISQLPICTNARIKRGLASKDIDQEVKSLLSSALSIYEVDLEKLKALKPDIIITQDQCKVCAVSESDLRYALKDWVNHDVTIVSQKAKGFDDFWLDVENIANVLNVSQKGKNLINQMKFKISQIREKIPLDQKKKRVAMIEWVDPLMAAGNWIPKIINLAGGLNIFGKENERSPYIKFGQLVDEQPEVIVIAPCGFNINRTKRDVKILEKKSKWSSIEAVQKKAVFIIDGNQYLNRPGPRLLDSIRILSEILHPEVFKPTYHGTGWISYYV